MGSIRQNKEPRRRATEDLLPRRVLPGRKRAATGDRTAGAVYKHVPVLVPRRDKPSPSTARSACCWRRYRDAPFLAKNRAGKLQIVRTSIIAEPPVGGRRGRENARKVAGPAIPSSAEGPAHRRRLHASTRGHAEFATHEAAGLPD